MRRQLSWKLAAVVTVGIAAVHTVFGYLRVQREATLLEAEMRRDHRTMTHALAVAATSTAARVGTADAIRLLEDADLETDHAEIRWRKGETATPRASTGALQFDATSAVVGQGDQRALVSTVPLQLGGEGGALEIREPLLAEQDYVRNTIWRTIVMTVVLVVLCFAILIAAGWVLVQRPMKALMGKVQRIGRGDLSGPLVLRQRDELGTLAEAINMMCERLEAMQLESDKQTRAKIAAVEQLRHADRLSTVGVLAAGVAHELGTPLNVVSARAKMIVRGQSEGDEAVDDAQVIVGQAERITAIIRQLLDFARRRKPDRSEEDLTQLCAQTLGILEPLARKSGVVLTLEGDDTRAVARVDAGQLQQVLTNLVMNAIQAQPHGGEVRVRACRTPELAPGATRERAGIERVTIVVEDRGQGMPESVRERLFEPFFTTKDVGQGTGLGLSVAYGIVREHGGALEVDTEPGHGSRFTIHLPQATA